MNNETPTKAPKKALNIFVKIITWMLIVFTVGMMIFTVFTTLTVGRDDRSIFGYQFFTVLSPSMKESETNGHYDVHFDEGDIIIAEKLDNVEITQLKVGDVISFISNNDDDSWGQMVTHMIIEVKRDNDGKLLGYVTFGVNNDSPDEALVEPEFVRGKYVGKLPGLGWFFQYVKSPIGYIIFIFVPFVLLILYNGMNVIILFRKYKKQQNAIIEAEKAEIAAERKQNEEMFKELQALKAQLEQQANNKAPQENSGSDNTSES